MSETVKGNYESQHPLRGPWIKAVLYLLVVFAMANLNALVDLFLHPEIPYFDEEHIVVGAVTALLTAILFGFIYHYLKVRGRTEETLRTALTLAENEKAKADAIIAALGDGVSIQDRDFKIIYQNQIDKDLIGDHFGEYCYEACEEKNGVCEGCPVALSFADGGIHRTERRALTARGPAFFEITASPLRDSTGKVIAGIEIARDITERKKMEDALQKNEEKYRLLFESNPHPMWVYDVETLAFLAVNETAVGQYGYTREEFLSRTIRDIRPPEDIPVLTSYLQKSSGSLRKGVWRHLKKDGTIIFVEVASHELSFEGRAARLILAHDVTERVKAEEELRRSEEEFRRLSREFNALLDAIPDSITLISPDLRVVWANSSAESMTEKDFPDIVGECCYKVWFGRQEPCVPCPVRKGFVTGNQEIGYVTTRDGRTLEIRAVPVKNHDGTVQNVIRVGRDITEHRKLEDQLRQSQKMEAIGQLAGGIAHDFNNILTAIIGYGNLLQKRMAEEDPLRTFVGQILSASERATNLTRGLLAFSRKQIINPRPVDLNDIIKRVERLLLHIIGEDIELRTMLTERQLTVFADSSQIEQVLMNLAANARDAMPEGGLLTIEAGAVLLDEGFTRAHDYGEPGPHARITISDTGTGMDEKTSERIFEPFFTTKEVGKGTGLGLSMVYGIIKQHGGYISVYSEPGRGTTFRIYLPLVHEEAEEIRHEGRMALVGGTEEVLLAEDDEAVREITRSVLSEYGYRVIEARDGEDALRKFEERKGSIALLVLDVVMPKKNGREVFEEVVKIAPGMKALFISGYTANIVHRKGVLEEGLEFISKPVSPFELLSKVREILDRVK